MLYSWESEKMLSFIVLLVILGLIVFLIKSYKKIEEISDEKIKLIKRVYKLEQQFLKIEEINKKHEEEIENLKSEKIVKSIKSMEIEKKSENMTFAISEENRELETKIVIEEKELEKIKHEIIEKVIKDGIEMEAESNQNKEREYKVDIIINENSYKYLDETEKTLNLINEDKESLSIKNIKDKKENYIEKNNNIELNRNIKSENEYKESIADKIKSSEKFENLFSIESIISKLGIMLFIIGMAFLFKYTYNKGLITKEIRIGAGIVIGFGFAVLTEFMHRKNREKLGQIVAGGSIAIFYLTIFAAFYLYKMVGYEVAFGSMFCVTVAAYLGSIKYNSVLLSIVGFAGGMATPFMLYTGEGSVSGLVMYNCFMILGTAVIYIIKGWKSLLWCAVIGAWGILGMVLFKGKLSNTELFWAISGILFHWVCFFVAVTYREVITSINPEKWKEPSLGYLEKYMDIEMINMIKNHIHVITIVMPILAMCLIINISGIGVREAIWGWLGVGAALIYFITAYTLIKLKVRNFLEYSNILSGVSLLLFAAVEFFKGDVLAVSIICEGAALIIAGYYLKDRFIKRIADVILTIGSTIFIKGFIFLIKEDKIEISSILSYTLIVMLGIAIVIFADKKLKKIYGIFYIQIVAPITIMLWSWYLSKSINQIIALLGVILIIEYYIFVKKNIVKKEFIHLVVVITIIYKIIEVLFIKTVTFNIGEMSFHDSIFIVSIWIISHFEKNKSKERKNYRILAVVLLFGLLMRDGVNIKDGIDFAVIIFGSIALLLSYFNLKKRGNDYFALKPALTLFISYVFFRYLVTFIIGTKGVIPFTIELFSILVIYIASISENRDKLKKIYGNIAVIFFITLLIRETGGDEWINWITPLLLIINLIFLKIVSENSYKKWVTFNRFTPFIGVIFIGMFRLIAITGENINWTQFAVDVVVCIIIILLSFKEKEEIKVKPLKISGYFMLMALFVREFYNIENGVQYIMISWITVYIITIFAEKKREFGFKIGDWLWGALLILTGGNIINIAIEGNYPVFALSVNIAISIVIIVSSFIDKSKSIVRNSGVILFTLSLIEVIQKVRGVSEINGILYIVLLISIIWIVLKSCEEKYNFNQPINRYIGWMVIGVTIGEIILRINSNIDFERVFIQVLVIVILHIGAVIERDVKRGEKIAVFLIPIILGYTYISLNSILLFLPIGGLILMVLQKIYKKYKKDGILKAIEWLLYIYTAGIVFGVIVLKGEKYGTTVGFIMEIIAIVVLFEIVRVFKNIKTLKFYEFLIHFLVIAAAYRNFADSASGNGVVSLIWGVYGLGIIVYGIIKTEKKKIYFALAIIIVVALKLLLIDLSELEPVWKILLFMGFGGALLAVSYYLHPLLQKDEMQ
jgi:hypothetical protein